MLFGWDLALWFGAFLRRRAGSGGGGLLALSSDEWLDFEGREERLVFLDVFLSLPFAVKTRGPFSALDEYMRKWGGPRRLQSSSNDSLFCD